MSFVNKLMGEQRACAHCGTLFEVWSLGRHKRFCTELCAGKARAKARSTAKDDDAVEVREAPPVIPEMPVTIQCPHALCRYPMYLDLEFFRDAVLRNNPTRRWSCSAGHSKYDPPPQIKTDDSPKCERHHHDLPCAACADMIAARRRRAGSVAGRTHRGKHSGSIWATGG